MGTASPGNLIFRTDANAQIGIGHVMRCLALAQAWQDKGGTAVFISCCENRALQKRITAEGLDFISVEKPHPDPFDIDFTITTIEKLSTQHAARSTWVVADGYHFDADYQKSIKEAGNKLLWVDDYGHADYYCADLILNQNICADPVMYYNRAPYTQLLLGTRYVLLRREFKQWKGWQRKIPPIAQMVLVTLGGGDPGNVTLEVIQALKKVNISGLEAQIVVGPANPNLAALEREVKNHSNLRLIKNAANMAELMALADTTMSAGGSTCWELAFMGVPNFILILADNQRPVAEQLSKEGAALSLGWYKGLSSDGIAEKIIPLMRSKESREKMALRGPELVDGEGAERVLMYIEDEKIRLRKAQGKDCRFIWKWSNDPEVREVSFSADPINWEQHVKWFESELKNPDHVFYVGVNHDDTPVGQVRYNVEDREAVISISIGQKFRGKGFGSSLIQLSSKKLFNSSKVTLIHAYVKPANETSTHVFLKTGFKMKGTDRVHNHLAVHLILQKDDLI